MFNIPVTNQKFYIVMVVYFALILVLANVGKLFPQLGVTNGLYLGLAASGALWHFVGRSYTGIQ